MAAADLNLSSLSISTMRRPGRRLSLRVLPDGTLKVNAPLSTSERHINKFLASKAGWISHQLEAVESLYDFSPVKQVAPGLRVEVINSSDLRVASQNPELISIFKPGLVSNWHAYQAARPLIKRRLGELARPVLLAELAELATSHGYTYSSCSIKFLRSRWGSCTSQGKIALNSQLIRLPKRVRLYVIAHELAHLKVANHSQEFYSVVGEMVPDYKLKRKELREFRLLH